MIDELPPPIELTPLQRTEFLRALQLRLRHYFPGCAVVVAVGNEQTGMSLAAGGPDRGLVVALAEQVADDIRDDYERRPAPGAEQPS